MNGYVIHNLHRYYGIDHYQDFIIGVVDSSEQDVDVSRLINISTMEDVASLATIHNALKKAIKNGFINLKVSEKDRRRKVLKLTNKSKKYLSELKNIFYSTNERSI